MPARKKPYLDRARVARVEAFFSGHLRHMKGRFAGKPFVLEPWQVENIIAPIFGTVDPKSGLRQYREALVGLPRKNGKSEIAAGIALYMLVADGEYGAEVYSVAGSRPQASIVFKTAADMVRASPTLRAACKVYRSVIEVPELGSIYRVLSSDANLAHGYNPHAAIIDELHIHPNSELYEAMRTGTAARSQPLTLSITTAGEEPAGIAWELHERANSKADPRLYGYWCGVPDGKDPFDDANLRAANPASWVSLEFLQDQRRSLPPAVFARLHANQWWRGATEAWLTRTQVTALQAKESPLEAGAPTVVAVDAASKRDTTAVMAVQVREGKFYRKCWHFAADEDLGFLDYGIVENLIRDICETYDVRRVAFDPFQMVRSAQILGDEGVPVETFPQNDTRMVPASSLLYDLVIEERLVLDRCETCEAQLLAAAVSESARGWRIHKRKSNGPIDATVALAMACQLAEWEAGEGGGPRVIVV